MIDTLEKPVQTENYYSGITVLQRLQPTGYRELAKIIDELKDRVNRLNLLFNITSDFDQIDDIIYKYNTANARLADIMRLIEPAPDMWSMA